MNEENQSKLVLANFYSTKRWFFFIFFDLKLGPPKIGEKDTFYNLIEPITAIKSAETDNNVYNSVQTWISYKYLL